MVGRSGKKFGLLFAALLFATSGALARELREVREPHFGEVLFQFFQDNHFSALTHHMTAQHFARLGPHADESELLRGGILLSYGAHVEAGEIFERLIETGATPAVRDRAWFYLAKIRYQRGYVEQAEEALARVRGALPGELNDERLVLHATLLMTRQKYAEAVAILRQTSKKSSWSFYGRYNLGVALIQAGERDAGVALLEEIGREPQRQEELAALRDKANVALAYVFLQDEKPARAKPYLDRVRLNGLLSNKALLGMGWTHSALDDYQRALVPWSELASRNVADAAVQESLLAVPYAYGKLGAYRQSLDHYHAALIVYTNELTRLDEAIVAIRAGKLVENILRANPADEAGWAWRMKNPPDTPEARYLLALLAGHDFQEAVKNYRDLRFLSQNLEAWSRNMHVYDDMVATRRSAYRERLPRVLAREKMLDVARLEATRARYAEELARIEREGDAAAFADEKERALLARVARAGRTLKHAPDATAQDKYRLLGGLLEWDLSAQYSARLWTAKQHLQEVDRLMAESETRRAALAQAQIEAPQTVDGFATRINVVRPHIGALQAKIDAVARVQEQYLATLAADELMLQRERIVAYVTQARFAVAQIFDRGIRAGEKTP